MNSIWYGATRRRRNKQSGMQHSDIFVGLLQEADLMNVNDARRATCSSGAHYFPIVRHYYFDWGHVGVANCMQTIALLCSWKKTIPDKQNPWWFCEGEGEAFQGWTKHSDGCEYGPCLTLRTTANSCSFSDRRSQFNNECPAAPHLEATNAHFNSSPASDTEQYCLDLWLFFLPRFICMF